MELGLNGKNAIICASSAGIGKGIATLLAKEGVNVSILARSEERLNQAKLDIEAISKVKVIATVVDLNKVEDIENVYKKTIEAFGSVDILINNHGGPKAGGFDDISMEDTFEATNQVLYSTMKMTKLCLKNMQENQWGRVINILSLSGKEPIAGMLLSNILRPAILGMAKTISMENAANGITVNSLLPAAVLSDRTKYFVELGSKNNNISYEEELNKVIESLPNKAIATPEQFGQMAAFLCSQNASFVNGTTITVDGGISKSIY
jgi:3-oxoacyl-[acyl-carrier protein] reductase